MVAESILFYGSKTSMKYGDPIDLVYNKSYIVVVKDGGPNLCDVSKAAVKNNQVTLDTRNFPHFKKPGLFSMKKEFPVKIFHYKKDLAPIPCERFEAKDRKTGQLLYYCTFQGLRMRASFRTSCPEKVEQLCKDLKIPLTPGKVLFTYDNLVMLVRSMASYFLGDLRMHVGHLLGVENRIIAPKGKMSQASEEFRNKFMKAMTDSFWNIGIVINFEDY